MIEVNRFPLTYLVSPSRTVEQPRHNLLARLDGAWMWTICSSQYGGGRVTRRLNRNSWRSVTGIAARMSYSTLDFRFLIPRGHHCDRRVVNGIVFRTTAIFYLPTTHERRRGEEAVSRHRGREIVDPCGGVVERYSRIKSYKWVVIHFP